MTTKKREVSVTDGLEWFFYGLAAFSMYLFTKGPGNDAQLIFRVSLLVVGLIGGISMTIYRTRKKKSGGE